MHKHIICCTGGGLGDAICTTPGLKWYHKKGYHVTLVMHRSHIQALSQTNFIDHIIPVGIYPPEEDSYSDILCQIEQYIQTLPGEVKICFARPDALDGYAKYVHDHVSCPVISPIDVPPDKIYSYSYTSTCHMGIEPREIDMNSEVGFERTSHRAKKDEFNIGICIGSQDKTRRLSPEFINKLSLKLKSEFSPSLFLLGSFDNTNEFIHIDNSLFTYISPRPSTIPINYCLTYIEQMDLIITPDSGLMHAALALNIPTISFQSRELPERVIPEEYHTKNVHVLRVPNCSLQCKKECNARLDEILMPQIDASRPVLSRQLADNSYSFNDHQTRWGFRTKYKRMKCLSQYDYGVECLNKIDIEEIVRIIHNMRHTEYIAVETQESTMPAYWDYYPPTVEIEATSRCNINPPCPHCPRAARSTSSEFDLPHVTKFESLIKHAKTLGLSGIGEPTISSSFEYLVTAPPKNCEVWFFSNGKTLTNDTIDVILNRPVMNIYFSVDAGTSDTYYKIRGDNKKAFDNVIQNITALITARDQRQLDFPKVWLCMTWMEENCYDLIDLIFLAHKIGAGVVYWHLKLEFHDYVEGYSRNDFIFRSPEQCLTELHDGVRIIKDVNVAKLKEHAHQLAYELKVPLRESS